MDALVLDIQEHAINNRLLYTVQVIHQAYRRGVFNIDNDMFTASNGFDLLSTGYPMLYGKNTYKEDITLKGKRILGAGTAHTNRMCVRGSNILADNHIMYIDSPVYIEQLKQAVKEYNIAMG